MNDWITILTFYQPHEAHVAAGYLEDNGIETFVKDEITAQLQGYMSNAMGGVKLQVRESQLEKVLPLLREVGCVSEKDFSNYKASTEDHSNKNHCPYCNSNNVRKIKTGNIITKLVKFFTGEMPSKSGKSFVCKDCRKQW